MNKPDDVRMKGFARRFTVDAAWKWVDDHVGSRLDRLDHETVSIVEAVGRVLATDVVSRVDVPMFDRAMMDGFAVHADDTMGATDYNPRELRVIGTALPNQPFQGKLQPGQAVRIMTGAPVPAGADAVIPVEQTESESEDCVLVQSSVPPQKHVGKRGEDIRSGATVLFAKRRLRPQDVGLLSSIGYGDVEVRRKPRVRVVVTGNELLPPGEIPSGYQIADANGPMLTSLAERDGARVLDHSIVPDQPDAIARAMQDDVDVVLVSGGSSVGQEDHAPRLLAELGEIAIHGIAMRPSSPSGMGSIGNRLVFLLPGNPVSCLCSYDFFAGRAIRQLAGRPACWPYRCERLPLSRKLVSQIGRVDYARVAIQSGKVEPIAIGGASVLSSTTRADGFVIIDADSEGFDSGTSVDVWLYD